MPPLGKQVDGCKISNQYLKETKIENDYKTRTCQMRLNNSSHIP